MMATMQPLRGQSGISQDVGIDIDTHVRWNRAEWVGSFRKRTLSVLSAQWCGQEPVPFLEQCADQEVANHGQGIVWHHSWTFVDQIYTGAVSSHMVCVHITERRGSKCFLSTGSDPLTTSQAPSTLVLQHVFLFQYSPYF